jgi:hypothetical protein
MAELFVEVLVAPARRRTRARTAGGQEEPPAPDRAAVRLERGRPRAPRRRRRLSRAAGDGQPDDPAGWRSVAKRTPTDAEQRALELAWSRLPLRQVERDRDRRRRRDGSASEPDR